MNSWLKTGASTVMACSILLAGCNSGSSDRGGATESESGDATLDVTLLAPDSSFAIVDTRQIECYDDTVVITCPDEDEAYYVQQWVEPEFFQAPQAVVSVSPA